MTLLFLTVLVLVSVTFTVTAAAATAAVSLTMTALIQGFVTAGCALAGIWLAASIRLSLVWVGDTR